MKPKKNLLAACVSLSVSLLLNACGTVKLHDREWCGDMGPHGALCFRTFDQTQSRELSKAEWDAERVGQICGKSEAYAEFKSALLRLCRLSRRCTYEEREALKNLGENLERVEERAKELGLTPIEGTDGAFFERDPNVSSTPRD